MATILNIGGGMNPYPVGSIYLSVNNTDPSALFGGTWERINGRFLLGADDSTYKAGETGGEASHTLTINEVPSHNHELPGYTVNYANGTGEIVSGTGQYLSRIGTGSKAVTYNSGGSQSHNNMPPYLTVYMWKRTA